MLKKFGTYLLMKTLVACWLALILFLLPWPFSSLSMIIVCLIVLRRGFSGGLSMLAWIILPVIAAHLAWDQISFSYDISFFTCLSTVILACVFRKRFRWSDVQYFLVIYGYILAFLLLVYMKNAEVNHFFLKHLTQVFQDMSTAMDINPQELKSVLNPKSSAGTPISFFWVSIFIMGPLIWSMAYLMLARLWEMYIYLEQKKSVELQVIQVNRIYSIIVIALFILQSLVPLYWRAPSMILLIPFLFSGFSIIIFFFNGIKMTKNSRAISALCLILVCAVLLPLLIIIGFIDSWGAFRKFRRGKYG